MGRLFVALNFCGIRRCTYTHGVGSRYRRPVYKAAPPAPPPVQDWSGIYVALEGG
jgi:hypothetical protein